MAIVGHGFQAQPDVCMTASLTVRAKRGFVILAKDQMPGEPQISRKLNANKQKMEQTGKRRLCVHIIRPSEAGPCAWRMGG